MCVKRRFPQYRDVVEALKILVSWVLDLREVIL